MSTSISSVPFEILYYMGTFLTGNAKDIANFSQVSKIFNAVVSVKGMWNEIAKRLELQELISHTNETISQKAIIECTREVNRVFKEIFPEVEKKEDGFEQLQAASLYIKDQDLPKVKFVEAIKSQNITYLKFLLYHTRNNVESMHILGKAYFFNSLLVQAINQDSPQIFRMLLDCIPDVIETYPNIILNIIFADHPPYEKKALLSAYGVLLEEYLFKNPNIQWVEGVKEWLSSHLELLHILLPKDPSSLTLQERQTCENYQILSEKYKPQLQEFFKNPNLNF